MLSAVVQKQGGAHSGKKKKKGGSFQEEKKKKLCKEKTASRNQIFQNQFWKRMQNRKYNKQKHLLC